MSFNLNYRYYRITYCIDYRGMNNSEYIDEYGVTYSSDRKKILRIPKEIVSYDVPYGTEVIGNSAAHSNCKLKSIHLPSSIKTIERVAFCFCNSLKYINLPDSLLSIGYGAFSNCHSIEEVSLPSKVNFMDGNPFASCSSLLSIEIADSDRYLSEDGILYDVDKNTIVCYPAGIIEYKYSIDSSITRIGKGSFEGNIFLETLTT